METEKTVKQVSRVNFYIKDFCGIKFIGDEREREEIRKSLGKFADKFLFDSSICCGGPKGYSMTFSRNTEYIPRIGELIELDTSSDGVVENLTVLFGENPRILEIFPKLKGEIKDSKEYRARLYEACKKFDPEGVRIHNLTPKSDFEDYIDFLRWPHEHLTFRVININNILNPIRNRVDICVFLELEQQFRE
jgi:hypothetical protein